MKVVVTGAAGFIGSNLVAALNRAGVDEIMAVDVPDEGTGLENLSGLRVADYAPRSIFYERFAQGAFGKVEAVLHQGACSDTTANDTGYMMRNNFELSRQLLDGCLRRGTRLIYASSAAIYGASRTFTESPDSERPLNIYGQSKLRFDGYVREQLARGATAQARQVVGLRYFNVYGPREQHKARMASVAFHHFHQFQESGTVQLFGAYGGYGPGEQSRDFIHVDDVVAINLWFLDRRDISGIFNTGTGRAQPFNDVALTVVNTLLARQGQPSLPLEEAVRTGRIEYIPFPEDLHERYQCFTQADLQALRRAGCEHDFMDVQTGVAKYMGTLL
ncbi:MAG: ADP-glyceromanno-heptose 6-epimerase [Candidatus Xenobium sp.]|nr:ADP-glyceromanno-heptose 6-epimerase [Burkholderiales bacterium]